MSERGGQSRSLVNWSRKKKKERDLQIVLPESKDLKKMRILAVCPSEGRTSGRRNGKCKGLEAGSCPASEDCQSE